MIWRDLFSSNRARGIRSVWVLLTELCGPRFSSMMESRLKEDETEWDMEVNEHSPCLQVIFLRPHELFSVSTHSTHVDTHTQTHPHAQKHTWTPHHTSEGQTAINIRELRTAVDSKYCSWSIFSFIWLIKKKGGGFQHLMWTFSGLNLAPYPQRI